MDREVESLLHAPPDRAMSDTHGFGLDDDSGSGSGEERAEDAEAASSVPAAKPLDDKAIRNRRVRGTCERLIVSFVC